MFRGYIVRRAHLLHNCRINTELIVGSLHRGHHNGCALEGTQVRALQEFQRRNIKNEVAIGTGKATNLDFCLSVDNGLRLHHGRTNIRSHINEISSSW